MKYRISHVTNSSSSSYIIAVKNGVTEHQMVQSLIEQAQEQIENAIEEYNEVFRRSSETEGHTIESVAHELVRRYCRQLDDSIIEGWQLGGGEISCEDVDGPEDLVMEFNGGIETTMFKIKYV